ncbi:MAG: ABC transporter permease [Alphaproteobacteria bacterium]|nr:ABC transporter permease [Alphaproteobacteria bacterium]
MLLVILTVILIVASLVVSARYGQGGGTPVIGAGTVPPIARTTPQLRSLSAGAGLTPAERLSFGARAQANWKNWLQRFGIIPVYVILILVFWAAAPFSFSWANHTVIWFSMAAIVVLAFGLVLPLTAGDFDLSIASVMVLSSMMIGALTVWLHWPLLLAILAALAAGALVGAINAFFILYFRIHSLIVTLGVGTIVNGVVIWFTKSATISNVPNTLVSAMLDRPLFSIPANVCYTVLLALAMWYFLEYTSPGRRLLFVGRGREVARLAGIRVDRVRAGALIACSMIAALSGVMLLGMTGSAEPINARFNLLPAFAGAFLGATSIYPGRFNPFGTLIGLYFLATGVNGLSMVGLPLFIQDLFYGGGLVIAVALSQIVLKRQQQNF